MNKVRREEEDEREREEIRSGLNEKEVSPSLLAVNFTQR